MHAAASQKPKRAEVTLRTHVQYPQLTHRPRERGISNQHGLAQNVQWCIPFLQFESTENYLFRNFDPTYHWSQNTYRNFGHIVCTTKTVLVLNICFYLYVQLDIAVAAVYYPQTKSLEI